MEIELNWNIQNYGTTYFASFGSYDACINQGYGEFERQWLLRVRKWKNHRVKNIIVEHIASVEEAKKEAFNIIMKGVSDGN